MQLMIIQSRTPPLLTEREFAFRLGVHSKTVARWRRQGRLRASYVGPRSIRYSIEELERFLADATNGGGK